jgi:predicted metal-dependent hydrolase
MSDFLSFTYGSRTIPFTLHRRPRTTLEISVEPDTNVTVVAPLEATTDEIEARLRKRAAWIVRQQVFFRQFMPRTPPRQYVGGETHRYLGRAYRLRVVQSVAQRAKLYRGWLVAEQFDPSDRATTERLVRALYRERAVNRLTQRVRVCIGRFPDPTAFEPRSIEIRTMRQRWGSLTGSRRLILNERLIEAPLEAIDYVIIHELCHVKEPHHGPAFFKLLDKVLPTWPSLKERLERSMM